MAIPAKHKQSKTKQNKNKQTNKASAVYERNIDY